MSIGKAHAQYVLWTPGYITETSTSVTITLDANKGNKALLNYANTSDVYVHIGAITTASTSPTDWKYAKFTWGTSNIAAQCSYLNNNKWKYTITGGLRTYFGITNATEKIVKIAFLFRNGTGSVVQRNDDGSDMYIPVYNTGLAVRIDQPYRQPKINMPLEPITRNLGDIVSVVATSSQNADLRIYFNGSPVGLANTNSALVARNATITKYGDQTIVAQAVSGTTTIYDTVQFFVNPPINYAPLPAGVKDGINYEPGDTSVTLVLYAPKKTRVAVIGDFSNWLETSKYQMNKTPDSLRYWIRITGLTPGVEYAYQYQIDGTLKVADIFSEKVLDPWNDQYIPSTNYPGLKPYPTGKTSNIVSVLQTRKPTYNWQVQNFAKPDKRNLIIYEMLVRDFVATQKWETIKDTLAYFKRLGVNAIQVMPFNEFEGNNSWGYNPDFYFAPDKMYGPEDKLRQFIDECHKNGIAVIMDIALNHAFGLSPTVQMYWDATLNKPATNNPWHNPDAKHPFNVGYDFNHESAATKNLVDRVIEHWLTKYKIDGFRWDLSKGFTQVNSGTDVGFWGNYDASRIAIWKRIYDKMQLVQPKSYCILEHFAANSEELELSNYGMLLWGNANHNYNEATMGYLLTSDFSYGIYKARGWTQPNLITYMESHDEERLMYKNLLYGKVSGSYSTKDLNTALKRMAMAASFWAMTPAPKMLWQFGELGYDYSINACENGTVNTNCRTSPKPARWDYLSNSNRRQLLDVYSKLLKLRNVPNFLPTFVTNDVSYNLSGALKWLQVNSDSLRIMVYGNFDVVSTTGTITFQKPGTWYNYLSVGTKVATGLPETVTLQPGEYYVYVSRADATAKVVALPLQLISFTANRTKNNIKLIWNTENEKKVKQFLVERSTNGLEFSTVGSIAATNKEAASYAFYDNDPIAISSKQKLYYRIKMMDIDGKFSYSNVVVVGPVKDQSGLMIYPNPVKGRRLNVKLNQPFQNVQVKIIDAVGRIHSALNKNTLHSNGQLTIDVGNLSKGLYLLKVEANEETYLKQFVIQE